MQNVRPLWESHFIENERAAQTIFENGMAYLEELIVFSNDIDYSENAWLYTLLVLLTYMKRALGGCAEQFWVLIFSPAAATSVFRTFSLFLDNAGKKILAKVVLNP